MKKRNYMIPGILLGILCIIGISYAYWVFSYQQTNVNKLTSSCFSLSLTNELNEINLQDIYPISDEQGMNLEPFKFTVKNTCNTFASYTVSLEILEGSTLKSTYVKSQINRESPLNLASLENTDTTIANSIESRILARGSLGNEDEEDYTVRLWMDKDTPSTTDSMNKTFTAKIVITGQPSNYSPVEQGITTLSDAMLANEYQTTPELAKQKIATKTTPDFSKTSPIIEWKEIHETNDTETYADKPHPDLYGKEEFGAASINAESAKLTFGDSYTFTESNPPKYTLQNAITVDPTTITDFATKEYYFCGGSTGVNSTTGIMSHSNSARCATMYKVNSITKTTSGTEGTNTYRIRYVIRGQKYSYIESEIDKSEKGLYQTQDDLGTSYYYRGSVNNNFVKFAGYYWRIIRRNGDGTVRLIYNGPNTNQTGETTHITGKAFNTQRNNPAYVGYMYGNTLNTSKEQTQANETNSAMKEFLESWYEQHLSSYDAYIADGIFCNDRSVTNGDGFSTSTNSYYGAYNRILESKTPTLKCPQSNDKFTVNEILGNGKNVHPIGLITADELIMAGAVSGQYNRQFYLYTGQYYWTMSPSNFNSRTGSAYELRFHGDGGFGGTDASYGYGVRALINLKADTEITGGIGTANDPFLVKGVA